jgi:hypothetical protein
LLIDKGQILYQGVDMQSFEVNIRAMGFAALHTACILRKIVT